jgi:hypothetical protein
MTILQELLLLNEAKLKSDSTIESILDQAFEQLDLDDQLHDEDSWEDVEDTVEDSGDLDDVLEKIFDHFSAELKNSVKDLVLAGIKKRYKSKLAEVKRYNRSE